MAGDKNKLTEKQRQILEYLKQEILQRGFPPSVREICEAVSLRSTSSVHAHLETLERKGYIKRDATKPRAIEICDEGFQYPGRLVQSRELHRKTPHPRVRLHRFR